MSQANVGYEVSRRKDELTAILRSIMAEHTARKGCAWKPGAIDAILCDLSKAVERQEMCEGKEAA